MSAPQYGQIPVRLALSTTSNPPVTPQDQNTGAQPQFFRAQGVAVQVGVFDGSGNPVDLSNLTYLQLVLMPSATALVPVFVKTILAASLNTLITVAGWNAGTAQNASFVLTAADTDQSLSGGTSHDYWLAIQGMAGGVPITYGAGPVTLYNPGSSIPAPALGGDVGYAEQTNGSGNSTVTPLSQNDTQIVTLAGSASTRKIILGTIGVVAGAQIKVIFNIPATAGIVVDVVSSILSGTAVQSFTTTGTPFVTNANLHCYFNGTTWIADEYQGPIP